MPSEQAMAAAREIMKSVADWAGRKLEPDAITKLAALIDRHTQPKSISAVPDDDGDEGDHRVR